MSVYMLSINAKAMQDKLNAVLSANEEYQEMFFASINTVTPALFSYSQSETRPKIGGTNIYCYIGVSQENLTIVTLNSLDVLKTSGIFKIPLSQVEISAKQAMGRCLIELHFAKEMMKLAAGYSVLGSDLKEQKTSVLKFYQEHRSEK